MKKLSADKESGLRIKDMAQRLGKRVVFTSSVDSARAAMAQREDAGAEGRRTIWLWAYVTSRPDNLQHRRTIEGLLSALRQIAERHSFEEILRSSSKQRRFFQSSYPGAAEGLTEIQLQELWAEVDFGVAVIDCDMHGRSAEIDGCVDARAVTLPDVRVVTLDNEERLSFRVFPQRRREGEGPGGDDSGSPNAQDARSAATAVSLDLGDLDVVNMASAQEEPVYAWDHHYFDAESMQAKIDELVEAVVRHDREHADESSVFRHIILDQESKITSTKSKNNVYQPDEVETHARVLRELEAYRVTLRMVPHTMPYEVQLHWIDFSGEEQFYGTIATYDPTFNDNDDNFHHIRYSDLKRRQGESRFGRAYTSRKGELILFDREFVMATFKNHCWTVRDNGTLELLGVFCVNDSIDVNHFIAPISDIWGDTIQ